jgi:SSS family solute:Na+ symporter
LVPPVVAVFILGLFWQGTTQRGALWGMILGHTVSVGVLVAVSNGFNGLHFLEIAGLLTALSTVAVALISHFDKNKINAEQKEFVWSRESVHALEKDLPKKLWWQDYRFHSVLLIVLTAWLVISHW